MDDFVSRLKMHMKERDVKQIDICRETGIPTSLMSNYLTDKKGPGLDNAIAIAEYFGMGLDEFLGIVIEEPQKKMYARTDLERRLILAFRRLAPSVQSLAVQLVENLNPDGDKSKREPKDSKPERLERSA